MPELRASVFAPRLIAVLAGTACLTSCDDAAAPGPPPVNVRVRIAPELVGSCASLGCQHTFVREVTETLGNPISGRPTFDVVPASSALTVSAGVVTVSPSAPAGDYRIRATWDGVSDTAVVRVFPRPTGKLVFWATVGTDGQIFVKDFATPGDATQLTTGTGTAAGLAVDQASGTIF